ncbi:MAG: triple tyrosine motif-containing protein [Chlorobium sp.]|nr:triple tyrosine motif-containing protein [Chlorobium sp.]
MKSYIQIKNIFILLLLLTSIGVFAQNQEPSFVNVPPSNGVSLNLTNDMLQDSKGFIWFGTTYGLVRYDGKNFVVYRYNSVDTNSISFDDISCLFEDSKGNLWVGTFGGGLNRFDANREIITRFTNNQSDPNSINNNTTLSISEDKNGNIWLVNSSSKIQKYEYSANNFTTVDINLADSNGISPSLNTLLIDDDLLWIGHSKGLSYYNIVSHNIHHFYIEGKPDTSFTNSPVTTIFKDSNGTLWIGTSTGLNKYLKDENALQHIKLGSSYSINSILENKSGNLWLGTNNGLVNYNPATNEYRIFKAGNNTNSISGNFVKKVLVNNSGLLWVASYNFGVTKCILKPKNFKTLNNLKDVPASLKNKSITAISEDRERKIYFGTQDGKIFFLNPETEKVSALDVKAKNITIINSLAVNKDILWIGTDNSILNYDLKKKQLVTNTFSSEQKKEIGDIGIKSIRFQSDSVAWIGTNSHGVFNFNIKSKELKTYTFNKEQNNKRADFILDIYIDRKDNLWISAKAGVYKFNYDAGEFVPFEIKKNNVSFNRNNVYSILEDSNGDFLFGTTNGFIKLDQKTNSLIHFTQKDGLPTDVITGIVECDNGSLWLSTNNGLSLFNPDKKSFTNFDEEDGLQVNIFNPSVYYKSSDGTIYFGGINGLTFFNPKAINLNKFNPPVLITSLKVLSKEGEFIQRIIDGKNIELETDENTLKIEFISIDYENSAKNKYQYKLSSFTDEWISNGTDNSVTFSNLPDGNYLFQVMGTNSDGVWSEKSATISFVIKRSILRAWWFFPALAVGLILILFIIHLFILKTKVKQALETENKRRHEHETSSRKAAADFYDELAHSLTRISLANEIVDRKIGMAFIEIKPLINSIAENAGRLYENLQDYIWVVNPRNNSVYDLMIRLKDYGDEAYSNTNINFIVDGFSEEHKNAILEPDLKREVLQLIKEGINNSLKHFNCQRVSLTSSVQPDDFELKFEEDGLELKPNQKLVSNKIENMIRKTENLIILLNEDIESGNSITITVKGRINSK